MDKMSNSNMISTNDAPSALSSKEDAPPTMIHPGYGYLDTALGNVRKRNRVQHIGELFDFLDSNGLLWLACFGTERNTRIIRSAQDPVTGTARMACFSDYSGLTLTMMTSPDHWSQAER